MHFLQDYLTYLLFPEPTLAAARAPTNGAVPGGTPALLQIPQGRRQRAHPVEKKYPVERHIWQKNTSFGETHPVGRYTRRNGISACGLRNTSCITKPRSDIGIQCAYAPCITHHGTASTPTTINPSTFFFHAASCSSSRSICVYVLLSCLSTRTT